MRECTLLQHFAKNRLASVRLVCIFAHVMTAIEQDETERSVVRVNFTLPPEVEELLEKRARTERRSKSAHVTWLIEQDAKAAGVVPAEQPA